MSEKLALISSLEPLKKGDQFETWPLHVTVMPWFTVPEDRRAAFDNALRNRMHGIGPIEMTGGPVEMFGPGQDVRVRTLKDIGRFAALHGDVLSTIDQYGGTIHSPYTGEAFRPHVTFQGERGIGEKETIDVRGMHLIIGDVDGPRTVLQELRFMKGQPKRG